MTGFDVEAVRAQFPMMAKEGFIYFDTGATALKPRSVINAMSEFYSFEYGTVHRAIYQTAARATARYNRVREKVQRFLNAARVEEIVFTKGTTDGLNLVAATLGKSLLKRGDEVIISVLEHHSNIVPWQLLQEERGIVLKVIPANEKGELLLDVYKELLTERTKVVSVAHVANSTGTLHPVKEIARRAHEKGALVVLDGAQAAPHMPVDVQEIGADFYLFSGHKAFGPTGIGILYGRYALLDKLPPYQGGGDMIDQVSFEGTSYQLPPLKFEAGTPPIAQVIGLGAALDFIEGLGRDKVAAYEHALLEYATDKLKLIEGVKIIGEASQKGAIISFVIDGIHPLDLGTLLDLKGVAVRTGHHCAQPALKHFGVSATLRLSFAPYNTFAEIDAFVQIVKEQMQFVTK